MALVALSILAWTHLNNDSAILDLHISCKYTCCKSQKQNFFTPKLFELEEVGFKGERKNFSKCTQKASDKVLKPAVSVAAPIIGMAVGAKTKDHKICQVTSNF